MINDDYRCPVCNHVIDNDFDICEYCLRNKTEKTINLIDALVLPKKKSMNFIIGDDPDSKEK